MEEKRIKYLDGFRGIFCVLILFEHYDKKYLPSFIFDSPYIRHSYIVVDFFFVISGFILALNYLGKINNKKQLLDYFKKRFFRLYPLLFITSSLMLVFEIVSNIFFYELKNDPDSLSTLWFRYMNDLLLTNSSFVLGEMSMNIPSWSISSEFFSYTIFGFTMLYFKKITRIYILAFLLFLTIKLILNIGFSTFEFGFIRGAYGFAIGVIISQMKISKTTKIPQVILLIILLIMPLLFTIPNSKIILSIVFPIIFSLILVEINKYNGFMRLILENRLINFLGKISFSIYLNHFLFVLILPRVFFDIVGFRPSNFNQILIFLLIPIVVVVYSIFTYHYIENKFNSYLRKKYIQSSKSEI